MGGWHIAATVFGSVSLVLLLIALASDHWVEAIDGNLGLWKFCIDSSSGRVCQDFGVNVKGFMHATRAFLILALFPGFIACALLFVLFSRTEIGSYSILRIVQISSYVAGGFALLAMIIFTGSYGARVSYGWSVALGWISAILYFLAGRFARRAITYQQI